MNPPRAASFCCPPGVEGLTGRGEDVIVQRLQQQLVGCTWGAKDAARLYWVNSGTWQAHQGGCTSVQPLCLCSKATDCIASSAALDCASLCADPSCAAGTPTMPSAGPDIPVWRPPQGKVVHGGSDVHVPTSQCCSKLPLYGRLAP